VTLFHIVLLNSIICVEQVSNFHCLGFNISYGADRDVNNIKECVVQ